MPGKEGIAFQFRNLKNQIRYHDKPTLDSFIFDLEQTLYLNLDLLKSTIETARNFNVEQKHYIIVLLKNIIAAIDKKKNLKSEHSKLRGKLLMDQQILEEFKRRNEENSVYFKEQIDEFQQNVEKKNEFIEQFEKKFREVDIYIKRQASNTSNPHYQIYVDHEILKFIQVNESYVEKRSKLVDEIKKVKLDIAKICQDNNELKKQNDMNTMTLNETKNELKKNENEVKKAKLMEMIKNFQSKIKMVEKNNNELRNKLKEMELRKDNLISSNNKIKVECEKIKKLGKEYSSKVNPKVEIDPKIVEEKLKNAVNEKLRSPKTKNENQEQSLFINETNFHYESLYRTNNNINRSLFGDISYIEKKE